MDLTQLSAYQFDLPKELIAQFPTKERDQSRLMVIDRKTESIQIVSFSDLPQFLTAQDQLIFNNSKVIPARLYGKRMNGGKAEFLLTKKITPTLWEVMAKPSRRLPKGERIIFDEGLMASIQEKEGIKFLEFDKSAFLEETLEKIGHLPLPPYIKRAKPEPEDKVRYQTLYAQVKGSLAAPTAGLHFTQALHEKLIAKGVDQTFVTLHVGLGTFLPVKTELLDEHKMHAEEYEISHEVALRLNRPKRNIAVGTTTLRTLESASNGEGWILPQKNQTSLFIRPGYTFKYTQALLTNFHLPGSTLLVLVSAFMGYELTKKAYESAIREKLRFFSYGDAMLIL